MNTSAKFLVVLSVVCFAHVAVADTAKKDIRVTISADVQQQLQKLSPNERNRIEAAIKMGNQFVPYYFDGSANNITDEQSVEIWRKKIWPLVNKDFDKWGDMRSEKQSGLELAISEREQTDYLIVCPQIELMLFQKEIGLANLKYRTRVIGALKFRRGMSHVVEKFIPDAEGDFQEVVVGVDGNSKIDYVEEKYLGMFVTTDFYVDGFNMNIETRKHRLVDAPLGEQAHAKDEIQRYKDWVKFLKEQEAEVCRAD